MFLWCWTTYPWILWVHTNGSKLHVSKLGRFGGTDHSASPRTLGRKVSSECYGAVLSVVVHLCWCICGAGDSNIVLFGGLRLQFDWTNACVPRTTPCAQFPSLHKCTPVSSHPQWRGRRFRMLKSGWGDGSMGKHWTEEITWVQIHRTHINKLGLLTCSVATALLWVESRSLGLIVQA